MKKLIAVLVLGAVLCMAGGVMAAETTGGANWDKPLPPFMQECLGHDHNLPESEFEFVGGLGMQIEYVLSKTNSIILDGEFTAPDFDIFDFDNSELRAVAKWKMRFGKVD
jgi:hypothetical protein